MNAAKIEFHGEPELRRQFARARKLRYASASKSTTEPRPATPATPDAPSATK